MKQQCRLLYTSDTHGAMLSINYAYNQPCDYGMAKVSTLIQKQRRENTVLIDCGDTIQGSPLMVFHHLHQHEFVNPVAKVFNQLSYDYFIPGNHDFNYGQAYFKQFLQELNAISLCANITHQDGTHLFDKPYQIHKFDNGIRLAIIGVTTDYIPNWERPANIENLRFLSPIESIRKALEEVKNQVDAIVVAYHGGFEKDLETFAPYVADTGENVGSRILETFPEIDVLLTGHQHRLIERMVGKTAVLQPGNNARMLGQVDFEFEDGKLQHLTPKLLYAGDCEVDTTIVDQLKSIQDRTNTFLDEPIGFVPNNDLYIDNPFQARLTKHKIVTFINQVQLEASKAMLSATSLGNDVTGFQSKITIRNVLSTYVYPNTLTVIRIDGKNLRLALEKNAEYFILKDGIITFNPKYSYPKIEHYNYDMFDGIAYEIRVSNPVGERIVSLKYAGRAVKDDDEFTLVLNNYRASGGGEFEMYQKMPIVREIQVDIAELMTEYIRRHPILNIQNIQNIKISF